nr:MAG TPA: hypothetical protein [Caudoviricetes sp.]
MYCQIFSLKFINVFFYLFFLQKRLYRIACKAFYVLIHVLLCVVL